MADDLGYGDIGPYDGWIDTPRLDRMARDGMRFLDFHSSGNVCSPTRAGLMTGRYQQRAGIPGVLFANPARSSHDDGIEAGELTLAEALRARGYATGIFGKWHLGYRARFNPVRHGFDEFRGFVSGNIDYRSHVDTMGRADWWRDDELSTEAGYATHLVTEYALRFIERHRDRPFFLYLPHHAPHYPFQGPDDPADRAVGGEFDPRGSVADRRRAYRDMVREMDAGVGEVLDALEAHGIADRTLVWFFSDNGAAQWGSNGPLRGLKATDWEGGHRLPSIAVWPARIPAGTESNQLVSALDGVDLSPVLLRQEALALRQLFWGADGTFWNGAAVRDGPWKLVIDRHDGTPGSPMLFNLDDDLGEQEDLAAAYPGRVERLVAVLGAWRADVGATP